MIEEVPTQRTSLVLSGGGMKAAAFHVGVSLALEKCGLRTQKHSAEDIVFDSYIGASAGSVIASFFAAGYSPQDVIYAFTQGKHHLDTLKMASLEPTHKLPPLRYRDIFSFNIDPTSTFSWLTKMKLTKSLTTHGLESTLKKFFTFSGLFNTEGLGKYFAENLFANGGDSFESMKKDLFIVATYLDHPEKAIFCKHKKAPVKTGFTASKYINDVSVSQAITASAALPPIFSPVKINGTSFFDGEIRDSLNSHIALDHKSDLVIISYSMEPYKYNENFGSLSNYGLPVIINQAINQLIQQKIINHRRHKTKIYDILADVDKILYSELPKSKAEEISTQLQKKFYPEKNSTVIYIHPSSQDHEMFFADHLSLRPKVLNKLVTIGFKSAMNSLRSYKFINAKV